MMCIISVYRGYEITMDKGGTFYAMGRSFNTAWGAICYIDEYLQP